MEAVAERLVKEAKAGRQVIVFTHNLFFHHALKGAAQSQKVKVREEWIAKHGDGRFGIIDDSQRPWASMKVKTRILDSTTGMWGDLQGIVGKALPEIATLDTPLLESRDD